MKKVKDVMVRDVISVKPNDPIHYVAWALREKKISGVPVVENKKVVGVVSERDIMRLIEEHDMKINLLFPSPLDVLELPLKVKHELDEMATLIRETAATAVEKIMTKKAVIVSPEATVAEAAKIMGEKKINRLPVVDKRSNLIGIITRGDVIGTLV
ncbi:MAG: CBS domain-containing protein [Candidatus Hydrothermarchaeales archaeon]